MNGQRTPVSKERVRFAVHGSKSGCGGSAATVLDNNNKNAEADPSTLFRRLSFDSFENVTQRGRIVILLRASLGGNKYRYFTRRKVMPNDGTPRKNGSLLEFDPPCRDELPCCCWYFVARSWYTDFCC
jgi:hypothetical protein